LHEGFFEEDGNAAVQLTARPTSANKHRIRWPIRVILQVWWRASAHPAVLADVQKLAEEHLHAKKSKTSPFRPAAKPARSANKPRGGREILTVFK
jgi:hypothetical protein